MTFVPEESDRVIVYLDGAVYRWKRTRPDGTTVLVASTPTYATAALAASAAEDANKVSEVQPGPAVEYE